jgi:hypothetical protein
VDVALMACTHATSIEITTNGSIEWNCVDFCWQVNVVEGIRKKDGMTNANLRKCHHHHRDRQGYQRSPRPHRHCHCCRISHFRKSITCEHACIILLTINGSLCFSCSVVISPGCFLDASCLSSHHAVSISDLCPHLIGGWHFPKRSNEKIGVPASPCSHIYLLDGDYNNYRYRDYVDMTYM